MYILDHFSCMKWCIAARNKQATALRVAAASQKLDKESMQ